ncbi:hypothetical protein [Herbiconiux sp.]|uniref:hypothetical protein n=1 Tax=Herbiconiux sp. TaxID=1871186 RepID=UPI0025BDC8AF|nr:hypothetical protein [Herbiconiux sp.]
MAAVIGTVKVPASIVISAEGSSEPLGTAEFELTVHVGGDYAGDATKRSMADALRQAADDIEAQLFHEPSAHHHRPVQHRDGKPPWCNACGLTASHAVPVSRFPSPPTRGPSGGAGDSGAADE